MFVYLVTTTDGYVSRVVTEGDPTDHPAFWGRVLSVETLGVEGDLLHSVWAMSDPYARIQILRRKKKENENSKDSLPRSWQASPCNCCNGVPRLWHME